MEDKREDKRMLVDSTRVILQQQRVEGRESFDSVPLEEEDLVPAQAEQTFMYLGKSCHISEYSEHLMPPYFCKCNSDKSERVIFRLANKSIPLPTRNRNCASVGYDITCLSETIIPPGQTMIFRTGISIDFSNTSYWCMVVGRSSMRFKYNLDVATGVVDPGFLDEVLVSVRNLSATRVKIIQKKAVFAQFVFMPAIKMQVTAATEDALYDVSLKYRRVPAAKKPKRVSKKNESKMRVEAIIQKQTHRQAMPRQPSPTVDLDEKTPPTVDPLTDNDFWDKYPPPTFSYFETLKSTIDCVDMAAPHPSFERQSTSTTSTSLESGQSTQPMTDGRAPLPFDYFDMTSPFSLGFLTPAPHTHECQ